MKTTADVDAPYRALAEANSTLDALREQIAEATAARLALQAKVTDLEDRHAEGDAGALKRLAALRDELLGSEATIASVTRKLPGAEQAATDARRAHATAVRDAARAQVVQVWTAWAGVREHHRRQIAEATAALRAAEQAVELAERPTPAEQAAVGEAAAQAEARHRAERQALQAAAAEQRREVDRAATALRAQQAAADEAKRNALPRW